MSVVESLHRWKARGQISADQSAVLEALAEGRPFSLYRELNILLYGGILFFIGGLGWTLRTHFQSLGDLSILVGLSVLLCACFFYSFSQAAPYASSAVASPTLIFDYVVYLGCLLWSVELGYLEFRYHVLAGQWSYDLLGTALLFFALAYRFDNRFVLSLALTSFAGWFGLKAFSWFELDARSFRFPALVYGGLVGAAGVGLSSADIKKHFLGTYLNFATHVLFVALLSGVVGQRGLSLWSIFLATACVVAVLYGIQTKQFLYVAYAAVYGYIGVSAVLLDSISGTTSVLAYFVISGVAMLCVLVIVSRRFGKES